MISRSNLYPTHGWLAWWWRTEKLTSFKFCTIHKVSALPTELKQISPTSTRIIHLRDVSKYTNFVTILPPFVSGQVFNFTSPTPPHFFFTGTLLQNIRNCKGTFVSILIHVILYIVAIFTTVSVIQYIIILRCAKKQISM